MDPKDRPDYQALLADLKRPNFLLGVSGGRWRLISLEWPHLVLAISAAQRPDSPVEYCFRFECTGYPRIPATGRAWDSAANAPLPVAKWPGGKQRVPMVFRPEWKNGECLYVPCDRQSIEGHDNWRVQLASMCWVESIGIVRYLEVVHELINSQDYTGLRRA